MAKQQNRNAFKTIKIKASTFTTDDGMDKLEQLFMTLEARKVDAVEAQRAAMIASAAAAIKQAQAIQAETVLIQAAGTMENRIARENKWIVFRDADGAITFEGITEMLTRNNFRAQQMLIGKQVADDDSGLDDMFEEGEED